jgi:hypothetical protein
MRDEDVTYQAEAFLDWKRRSGGTFKQWSESKGLTPDEDFDVYLEVTCIEVTCIEAGEERDYLP